jgi:hypothetical protein
MWWLWWDLEGVCGVCGEVRGREGKRKGGGREMKGKLRMARLLKGQRGGGWG